MELKARPEMAQAQVLNLTPELLQALSFLALPSTELSSLIAAELEANPLLKWADPDKAPASSFTTVPSPPKRFRSMEGRRIPSSSNIQTSSMGGRSADPVDFDVAAPDTLRLSEHLIRQIDLATSDPMLRALGRSVIDALDPAGYLTEPLEDLAAELGRPAREAERALKLVQDCEPTGVGARSLRECLLLQLRERGQDDVKTMAVLERLDLVARRDWEQLQAVSGLSRADISEAVKRLTTLNPKPGLAFSDVEPVIREPDILVRAAADGGLVVELNPNVLPKILVDKDYHAHVAAGAKGAEDKAFLNGCLERARWLSRTLERRADTLLKVGHEIVRRQEGYFRQGFGAMRPLTLKDIAEAVEMHESTISRTVSNKSFQSPHGMIAMRDLFSAALRATGGGEDHSARAVCFRMQQLVANEAQTRIVLSDERLADILVKEGVSVARRTVAKYRKILRIPSSAMRRRILADAKVKGV